MADPETIYNWRRLTDRITSGRSTETQLADIERLYVRHIVNLALHTHEKAPPDEARSVRSFQWGFLSSERSMPARPCADRCATGKCQPCLIAIKRRPKHKAPPVRAEAP